ncbi:hypothetical protein EPUS_06680 [Endocarpon pusillum Z07020]|uniref:Heterokaryon incompatibility domain-containing protein n=1 Tax=Endocarpon pusillum (strain Z07020 / HMAS-L-300199) TaxID=1263415 RepID=U1GAE6_ENDPU|nr:uncharacterized protein EPUS_06680 [Endocarpon pusillum Z07020]ERF68993.1 hypothetical protein EPUS_06680 [Endocarpon pusillum Z07020]
MASQSTTDQSLVTTRTLEFRLQKQGLTNKPESAFKNFYTPKNDFFYSNSPYLDLDSKRREIRLLRVLPPRSYAKHLKAKPWWIPNNAKDGQPITVDKRTIYNMRFLFQKYGIHNPNSPLIACEIVDKVPLSRVDGDYCAISYCAGKPTDTAVILVDGLPFNAFANLEHAIRRTQRSWTSRYPKKELLLWADQICINQRNDVEKTRQVQIMRDIYQRCNETFICLSTPGCENQLLWVPRSGKVPAGAS